MAYLKMLPSYDNGDNNNNDDATADDDYDDDDDDDDDNIGVINGARNMGSP